MSDKNKLRGSGENKIFAIYEIDDSGIFTEPMERIIYHDRIDEFKEHLFKCDTQIPKIARSLNGQGLYKYPRKITHPKGDRLETEILYKISKNSDTPYICFDKKYNSIYGVVDINLLK
jgi:hypothetical protein